ncbi:MAG: hypothetical protein HUU50_22375 [Candidatus Brocadiae bacterium]|nr:hypothetical protein [Candidatus Brocadiia bacterium]
MISFHKTSPAIKCHNCLEYNETNTKVCIYCHSPIERYKKLRSFIVIFICIFGILISFYFYKVLEGLREPPKKDIKKKFLSVRAITISSQDGQHFYTKILPDLKNRNKIVLLVSHDEQYFYMADHHIKLYCGVQ